MFRVSAELRPRPHDATNRGDKSPRLHCCCDKVACATLSLRYVARIQTSLNSCDRSQRQNSVAATMIFSCHTRRFVAVAAACRGDVSQRFVASCVLAFIEKRIEVWEKSKQLWKHSPVGSCSYSISHSSKLSLVFLFVN